VLALASGLAWLVAGRVLAPLRGLRDTAQRISETDITRRIDVAGSDEIAELGHTFNAMLDRLEQAFAVQRDFVSDAGHELRTPITIIRGHLELLGDDPAERRETVAIVTDELDRMSRFVDDLLTLARTERPDFLHPEDLDIDALTEELLAKARALDADRAWRLEAAAPAQLRGDRQRLTQAVMNLARNAVEHTGPGDVIALGSSAADGEARLWVRDTGSGVPAAEQQRIFERFARAGRSQRRSDGAGLGLAIVRAIAEAHGGRVELRSSPGAGATFTIVIPTPPQEGDPA
jgi:signal transduction histidine kinase